MNGTTVKIRFQIRNCCSHVTLGISGMMLVVVVSKFRHLRMRVIEKITLPGACLELIQKVIYAMTTRNIEGETKIFMRKLGSLSKWKVIFIPEHIPSPEVLH